MFVSSDPSTQASLKNCVLILPAVSVGNVAQLAVDVLISSLPFVKVGYIHDECIQPVVANDVFALTSCKTRGRLAVGLEVFMWAESGLVLIQQRAPILPGRSALFASRVLAWAEEAGVAQILLLSSCHEYTRSDSHLSGSQFRYVFEAGGSMASLENDAQTGLCKIKLSVEASMKSAAVSPLEDFAWPLPPSVPANTVRGSLTGMMGGGVTKWLVAEAARCQFPCTALISFASDGDNAGHALQLAACGSRVLRAIAPDATAWPAKFTQQTPRSWAFVFGPPSDRMLYQ